MENKIEEESRMGGVWSLCWIAHEIGSINLSTTPPYVPFTGLLCDTQGTHAVSDICLYPFAKLPNFIGCITTLSVSLQHLQSIAAN